MSGGGCGVGAGAEGETIVAPAKVDWVRLDLEMVRRSNAEHEVEKLRERRDELLALVAKISKESISPDEAAEMTNQIAALIAEVGTLRAELAEAKHWPHCYDTDSKPSCLDTTTVEGLLLLCTLDADHPDDHAALGADRQVCARWSRGTISTAAEHAIDTRPLGRGRGRPPKEKT